MSRFAAAASVWGVVLIVQYVSVWVAALSIGNGAGSIEANCRGTYGIDSHGEYACQSAWGGWSPLLYAPEILVVLVALSAVVVRDRRMKRAALIAAGLALIAVWLALFATGGWAVGQMPVFPDVPG